MGIVLNNYSFILQFGRIEMYKQLLYIVFILAIFVNNLAAHDISTSTCYSQSLTRQNSFRLSMVRGSFDIIRYEMASANIIQDNLSESKYYISTNSIFILLNYFAANTKWERYLGYILIPQMFGNMKFNMDIYQKYAQLTIGQTTDYYLHYKVSRIFTASSVGIESHLDKVRLAATFEVPLSKGYRKDRSPYFQVLAGYYF